MRQLAFILDLFDETQLRQLFINDEKM